MDTPLMYITASPDSKDVTLQPGEADDPVFPHFQ